MRSESGMDDEGYSETESREEREGAVPASEDGDEQPRESTSTAQERDWISLPRPLRCPRGYFPMSRWGQSFLSLPLDRITTMDAVSRCWTTIAPDSNELLSMETDGGTWAICEPCVTQIPKNITKALKFFSDLESELKNLNGFVAPSRNVTLRTDRRNPKVVTDMMYHSELNEDAISTSSTSSGAFDINEIMLRRERDRTGMSVTRIQPLKIRLAFTGVNCKLNGKDERMLVAVLLVTWARNMDLLGLIMDVLLKAPHANQPNYKLKFAEWERHSMTWKTMLRMVAFNNLGIDGIRFGVPEDYYNEPGGALGVDSLLNVFGIPLQIHGIVKSVGLKKIRTLNKQARMADVTVTGFRIVGMPPELEFSSDADQELIKDYVNYMHEFVDNMGNERNGLSAAISALNSPEEKGKDKDNSPPVAELSSWGGWPRGKAGEELTQFGLPPLPIVLKFVPIVSCERYSSIEIWIAETLGGPNGLPDLVKTCLRTFLLQDQQPEQINWDLFLTDDRPANPALALEKYYGEHANPLAGLCIAGHLTPWWKSMLSDIENQRKEDSSVSEVMRSMVRYIKSALMHHESCIETMGYRSQRVAQSLEIIRRFDFASTCVEPNGHSIRATLDAVSRNMGNSIEFDPYKRSAGAFMLKLKELNESYALNSTNLEFLFQMMITRILWFLGSNHTVPAFFQSIHICGGCNSFEVTTKEGKKTSTVKVNSSGADMTAGVVCEMDRILMDLCGISDPNENMQSPIVCNGWTPASIPLMTNATMVNGKITSLPDQDQNKRDIVLSELRGQNMKLDQMVTEFFPRLSTGNSMQTKLLNTCDPEKTGVRQYIVREKIENPHTLFYCSNQEVNGSDIEASKSASIVLHSQPPGSAPFCKKQRTGDFNSQTCHAFSGRNARPRDGKVGAFFFSYSQLCAMTFPALMNNMGIIPIEVNPTVLSLIDWLANSIKSQLEGVMTRSVVESFSRMVRGYTTRNVGLSLWTTMIHELSQAPSLEQAVQNTVLRLQCHALSLDGVVRVGHDVLTRGVHMGALLMTTCFAKHLEVPVVNINALIEFFESPQVPTSGEALVVYRSIKAWIEKCIRRNRFCPETPGSVDLQNNISCYVTSDGNMEGGPADDKKSIYRIMKSKFVGSLTVEIDKNIKNVFGVELFEACHMEKTMYGNALDHLINHFTVDLRKIMGPHVFASKRHMTKLGLSADVPGLEDFMDPFVSPAFARLVDVGGDASSQPCAAVGVNMWALLTVASLSGAILHPKICSKFASNVVKLMLEFAPVSAVPGKNVILSRFNMHTTAPERIIVSGRNTSLYHLLRPTEDLGFLTTGKLTIGPTMGNLLPEDQYHCGFLGPLCDLYHCDMWSLEAEKVIPEPELLPDHHYSVWRARDQVKGSLLVNTKKKIVELYVDEGEVGSTAYSLDYSTWHLKLREKGFLVMPMIWRSGACIKTLHGDPPMVTLGCLVPFEAFNSNYNHERFVYRASIGPEGEALELSFRDTIEALVRPGEDLFLDLDEYQALRSFVPSHRASRRYLLVRLSVPRELKPEPGKLSLVFTRKSILATTEASNMSSGYVLAYPWHLSTEVDASDVVSFLNPDA